MTRRSCKSWSLIWLTDTNSRRQEIIKWNMKHEIVKHIGLLIEPTNSDWVKELNLIA